MSSWQLGTCEMGVALGLVSFSRLARDTLSLVIAALTSSASSRNAKGARMRRMVLCLLRHATRAAGGGGAAELVRSHHHHGRRVRGARGIPEKKRSSSSPLPRQHQASDITIYMRASK